MSRYKLQQDRRRARKSRKMRNRELAFKKYQCAMMVAMSCAQVDMIRWSIGHPAEKALKIAECVINAVTGLTQVFKPDTNIAVEHGEKVLTTDQIKDIRNKYSNNS